MTQLTQLIGRRPYWRGYDAPSTAFLTTEKVAFQVGHGRDPSPLHDDQFLPDLFDVLVNFDLTPLSVDPTVSLRGKTIPIFREKLASYRFSILSLLPQGVVRVGGMIQQADLSAVRISTYGFSTLETNVVFEESTNKLKLGGFWEPGAPVDDIRQYSVTFYELDQEIHYRLHPENSYGDYIRDRQIFLGIGNEEERDKGPLYESIDIQRHGTQGGWVTFRKWNR
jgi:hypothetical protein